MEQRFLDNITELTEILKEKNVKSLMMVCDSFFPKLKEYGKIKEVIQKTEAKIIEFTEFEPNPQYTSVAKAVRLFEDNECTFIIAVGGGSAIDVAKCIKAYAGMDRGKIYLKQDIVDNGVKLLAVPTTSGTGSESTKFAVIYYDGEKQSVNHEKVLPEYVWLEPETIYSLPEYQKKCTMMDALCHSIESMWSMKSTEESRKYSKKAIAGILANKDKYLENDAEAVKNIMLAANYAGKAINITTTTAGHAMCYKITSLFKIPHGHAAIICLPKLWKYMITHMSQCSDKRGEAFLNDIFLQIAESFGKSNPKEAAEYIENIILELGLGTPALENEEQMETLVKSVNVERLGNNPVMLSEQDLRNIYKEIFGK